MNSQNDLVYAPVAPKKCDFSFSSLLRTHPIFNRSVIASDRKRRTVLMRQMSFALTSQFTSESVTV